MIGMSSKANRSLVTFKSSSFNTTEARPYFIDPNCFGDDLANWLIEQLTFRENRTYGKPSQRDYGWYLLFRPELTLHRLALTFIPTIGGGEWLGCIERCGFSGLLRKSSRTPDSSAVEVIHRILSASSLIQDIQWHNEKELEEKYKEVTNLLVSVIVVLGAGYSQSSIVCPYVRRKCIAS